MSFLEIIDSARAFLERNGRVSLRVLKREFTLDDDALEELVEELVDVQQVAAREGKILAWLGTGTGAPDVAVGEVTPGKAIPAIETAALVRLRGTILPAVKMMPKSN